MAELDADVDDVIAAEYLHKFGILKAVVCDPWPKTPQGRERKESLEQLGVSVTRKMPPGIEYVFVGGALTEVARYLHMHRIKCLVMNGGYVGPNIMEKPLDKFKSQQAVRTFNFNCDVTAADYVLKSRNIDEIILVGKNVCHHPRNTAEGIWKEERPLLEKYKERPKKLQHDMLACHEGIALAGIIPAMEPYLEYENVYPYNEGLRGNMTKWGSKRGETGYRMVKAAVGWKENS